MMIEIFKKEVRLFFTSISKFRPYYRDTILIRLITIAFRVVMGSFKLHAITTQFGRSALMFALFPTVALALGCGTLIREIFAILFAMSDTITLLVLDVSSSDPHFNLHKRALKFLLGISFGEIAIVLMGQFVMNGHLIETLVEWLQ